MVYICLRLSYETDINQLRLISYVYSWVICLLLCRLPLLAVIGVSEFHCSLSSVGENVNGADADN